jgi:competence protein ComEA
MEKYLNKEFLLTNKDKIIKVAVVIVIIAVAFFVFVTGDNDDDEITLDTTNPAVIENTVASELPEKIIVDVAGAVNNPKVVELEAESRVADAIAAAGGLTEDADTSHINQAAVLNDGEKIYIPEEGEDDLSGDTSSVFNDASKIDINTATSEELQTLNGIGPATAEKIISYRSDVGYFKSIDELKNVDGIGDKTYEDLKDDIMV